MVQTPHFSDILFDRVDLVLGSKGAGKSSLFRIFGELLTSSLLKNEAVVTVTGVETKGEPIFKAYSPNFEKFSEAQFEAFWKAYLLSLAYNRIVNDESIYNLFASRPAQLEEFKKQYKALGLIDVGRVSSPTKLLKLICAFAIAATEGVEAAWDVEKNQIVFGLHVRQKIAQGYERVAIPDLMALDTVLCIDALARLAEASRYSIWILLDHLDVVFKRRSPEETRALRALLKVLYAFTNEHLKLKIFLRDDILQAISSDEREPLAALSHITARSSSNLNWTPDSLCVLIMKRFAADQWVSDTYDIDPHRVDDADYARASFHKLFAFKYVTQQAFDWILSLIADGRGVVTPRDLIDLLKRALHLQALWLQRHPDENEFMNLQTVQLAHKELSINRRETVLQTEFSHVMHWIRFLERRNERYGKEELPALFGEDAPKAIAILQAIGVISFDHKKACYRVAKLYGPGLEVFATRAKKQTKPSAKG